MDDRVAAPAPRATFRATITSIGHPGPIEERVGSRRVRIVNPESREGAVLLSTGQVTLIGPRGALLGRIGLDEARRLLAARLEALLHGASVDEDAEAIRDGLVRLRRGSRLGRA